MVVPHRSRLSRYVPFLALAFALSLNAQSGDRTGEIQKPPPEHWEIPPAPALSVEEALETFKLPPGFRIEVVAADPLVFDPVAMHIGPDGRIWVVEMRAYMPNVNGIGEDAPIGTIAVLSDTDGDGQMDKRTEFASGLMLPRALALVGDGVLVAEPPNLLFFRDTDGDNVADDHVVVSGRYGNVQNPEHSANGLLWGLDNWIYSANHDERYRYRNGEWETAAAPERGQWGITQDDSGRLFYNNNSSPLFMDVFPGEYVLRNPAIFRPQAVNHDIAPKNDIRLFPVRITPGVNRGYRILDDDGVLREVTAACGPVIYRGGLLPGSIYGDAFICEPAANLVKRITLSPTADGDIAGRNAYEDSEFLASTDERFRPVNLANGHDGALYVVDMYRGIIQHRIYVTSYLRKQILDRGLEVPVGMGRIYRIVPDAGTAAREPPALHKATTAELIAALSRRDAWWRETSQRLLVERADPSGTEALRHLVLKAGDPGRLHALWVLHGNEQLDNATLLAALRDPFAPLQIAAMQALEPAMSAGDRRLVDHVLACAESAVPEVRRQATLTLAHFPSDVSIPLLVRMAIRDGHLTGMAEAIVSGLEERELDFLTRLQSLALTGAAGDAAALAVATVVSRGEADGLNGLRALAENAASDDAIAAAIVAGFERNTIGRKDSRVRLKLPVEPDALTIIAERSAGQLAQRASDTLGLIEGPAAQAMRAPVAPLTPEEQLRFTQGQTFYALCAACHQANGRGLEGLAPSLAGSKWANGDPEMMAAIVLKGKTDGKLTMPPLAALDDTMIAAVLTYVRRSFNNEASAVSPDQVAAARRRHEDRNDSFTDESLEELAATAAN